MLLSNFFSALVFSILLLITISDNVSSQNLRDILRSFEVNFKRDPPKDVSEEALQQYTRDKRTIHSFLAGIGDIFGLDVSRRPSSIAPVASAQLQVAPGQVAQLPQNRLAQFVSVSSPADGALQRQVLLTPAQPPLSESRRGFGFNINFRRSSSDTRR